LVVLEAVEVELNIMLEALVLEVQAVEAVQTAQQTLVEAEAEVEHNTLRGVTLLALVVQEL
jgi:hypothetical protein